MRIEEVQWRGKVRDLGPWVSQYWPIPNQNVYRYIYIYTLYIVYTCVYIYIVYIYSIYIYSIVNASSLIHFTLTHACEHNRCRGLAALGPRISASCEKHMACGGGSVAPSFVWSFGCTIIFYQFTLVAEPPGGLDNTPGQSRRRTLASGGDWWCIISSCFRCLPQRL